MAERKIHCLMLRQKLQSYYQHHFPVKNGLVPLKKNAQLANALSIDTGTLSNHLNGRNDGREDHLPPKYLSWLTDQYVMATEERLCRTQAYDLWRYASVSAFEYHLRDQTPSDLMSILLKQKPTLKIEVGEAPISIDLNMFEEPFDPLPNERIIETGRTINFEIETLSNRSLVLLLKSPVDWFWLSPSPHHEGPTKGGLEVIPPKKGFRIKDRGPHTIIGIELENPMPPFVRKRDTPPALKDHMERALKEGLFNVRSWRWGETKFFADKPDEIVK